MLGKVAAGLVLAACIGCSAASENSGAGGSAGAGNGGASGSGAAGASGTFGTGGSSGTGGTGLGLDATGGGDDGCKKIDFLFVLDNSGSMFFHQVNLVNSFPGFIQTIQSQVQGQDYHLMVIDTDADGEGLCETDCALGHFLCPTYPCGTVLTACDKTLGAGVVRPYGLNASNKDCALSGGQRYIVDGQPNLADTFGCIATVGASGSGNEMPMNALIAALGSPLAAPGACNEGFLRKDAILVVTIVSDAPPDTAMEQVTDNVQDWYDAVVQEKGDPSAIVVIGLFTQAAAKYQEFVAKFGASGFVGSVEEQDYSGLLAEAIAPIDTTCDNFTPPR